MVNVNINDLFTDNMNNVDSIKRTLSKLEGSENVTLVFNKREYSFLNEKALKDYNIYMMGKKDYEWGSNIDDKNYAFVFKNIKNLIIDGQGAELLFSGLIQPFEFDNCQNITLKNFSVNWTRPIYSLGEIIKVEDMRYTIKLFEALSLDYKPPISAILNYDLNSKSIVAELDTFFNCKSTELLSEDTIVVNVKKSISDKIKVGDGCVLRYLLNYRPCFHFWECSNVNFNDITIYSNPGMGVIAHRSSDFSFKNFRVQRSEKLERVLSTNTDATHFINCKGSISFDNCYFNAMGDDAVNVHGFYMKAKEIISKNKIKVFVPANIQDEVFDYPDVGDRIEFVKEKDLFPFGFGNIKNVEVDKNIGDIYIEFEENLPENFQTLDLIANATRVASLKFKNCRVDNNRARALLIQTRNVVVDNNIFNQCTGTGIVVDCADGWYESIGTQNVTISNNKFIDCGNYGGTYDDANGIAVITECAESVVGVHRDIYIKNNIISCNEKKGKLGIKIRCAKNVVLEGNVIKGCSENIKIEHSEEIKNI